MKKNKPWLLLLGVAFARLLALSASADEPAKADGPQPLVITDGDGKVHKLTTWKFTTDTRRLNWLAPKDKPLEGPLALHVRELDSTSFAEGVLTLVPVQQLRALDYDEKKNVVKLTVATGPKETDTVALNASTGFKNTNRPTLEGEVEKGTEKLTFLCGVEKGIKSAKFPATKVEAQPAGRMGELTTKRNGADPTTHKMADFQPLYRFADGSEVLSPTLYCKDLKVEMAKITKIERSAGLNGDVVWVLSFKGKVPDETATLTQMPKIDGKEATLIGFIGRVPGGYKLFPAALVEDVEFDAK